ncbi:MAG TPA: TRAP transporter large permease subunit [Hyphomicrobiaceae bacterium]|nr:TRAP transporter large permease subunit [Hyphomicrobiaceae bacterium]
MTVGEPSLQASYGTNTVGPQPAAWRSWLGYLDRALQHLIEVAAAILIVVETMVLLAGVVARYVFQRPLIWSDDLASLLFIWLIMLGAVIALRRGAHMRLTLLVNANAPQLRPWLESTAVAVTAVFFVAMLQPAYEYTVDEAFITMPGLGLSSAWRSAALFVGAVLMLSVLAAAAVQRRSLIHLVGAICLVAAVAVVLWLATPVLTQMGKYNLIVFFVALVSACVILGIPIAFSFGVATVAYLGLMTHVPLSVVVSRMQEGMSHLILLSVPLFIFLGMLIELTGMARAMVDLLAAVLGRIKGGLSYVLLAAMYLVSGISGAKAADMAAIAPVLFPEMRRRGTPPGELVALLSTSAAMSETIPPALVLIIIGSVTDVSIAALFTGGLLPALVLAIALGIIARYRARHEDVSHIQPASYRQIGRVFVTALPALALPLLIRSAVVEGVATATEVSTIGIAYAVLCGIVIYRSFDWRRIYPMLIETASLTGAILIIIGAATAMAWALTQSGFSRDLAATMAEVPGGHLGFLMISIVVFVFLGAILEGIPALVLFGPLLFPVARMVGIHEVHYAMVVILAMGIGLFAPPLGIGYYMACAIGRADPDEGMRPIWPYLAALFVGLLVVAFFPWLSIGFL